MNGSASGEVQVRVLKKRRKVPASAWALAMVLSGALAGVLMTLGFSFFLSSNNGNLLFESPEDLGALVNDARAATVTIYCENGSGSGWVIDLEPQPGSPESSASQTEIITNHHVIEPCIEKGEVSLVTNFDETMHLGYIFSHDGEDADLALIVTDVSLPALSPALTQPQIGQWVMAVGSPGVGETNLLQGNVTFGRITNLDGPFVVTDAAVNPGNSGGPLINSMGQVVGTNTWLADSSFTQNIAYAQGTVLICSRIIDCSSRTVGWQPTEPAY